MRVFLFFLCLMACIMTLSQERMGISYQGVASDTTGSPISLREISIQISILIGDMAGDEVFVEVHEVSTNELGYFTLVIGEGSRVSGDFESISWNDVVYFLRTEVDLKTGAGFKHFGTSQILAVPYAYYAEKAGSVESPGTYRGLLYPDGLSGEAILLETGESFTVPAGKSLYMLSACPIQFEGISTSHFVGAFGEGATITIIGNRRVASCLLVDNQVDIIARVLDSSESYIVPSNKDFYYFGMDGMSFSTSLSVNGNTLWYKDIHVSIFPGGTVLGNPGNAKLFLNGYLKDKN